jgi:hypothetical protein
VEGKEASPGARKHVGFGGSGRGSGRIWAQRGGWGLWWCLWWGLGARVGGQGSDVVTWSWSSCRQRLRKDDVQEAPPSNQIESPRGFLRLQVHESRRRELAAPFRRRNGTKFGSQMAIRRNTESRRWSRDQIPTQILIRDVDLPLRKPAPLSSPCAGSAPQKINQPPQHRTSGLR